MADNYTQFSAFLQVPADQLDLAQVIIDRETERLYEDDDEGYCGVKADMERDGVWFHEEESGTPTHCESNLLISQIFLV